MSATEWRRRHMRDLAALCWVAYVALLAVVWPTCPAGCGEERPTPTTATTTTSSPAVDATR